MQTDVMLAEVRDQRGLERVVRSLGLDAPGRSGAFVVKPAWFSPHRANFVGACELDLLLSSLPPGRRLVVEGYSGARNFGGRDITAENGRENWEWIREQDQLFRDRTGISAVLTRHNAEYLNVTEEVWQGRAAPAAVVRGIVGEAYGRRSEASESGGGVGREPPVLQEALFEVVPQRLLDLRGSVLISFAKLKSGSWSLKNLFGLIPDPIRLSWHGERGGMLGRSIVDISAVYRALFEVVGIVEAIHETALYREGGRRHTDWGDYDVVAAPGLVLAGWKLVTLDCCAARVVGSEIGERSFARIGEAVFRESASVPARLAGLLDLHAALHWEAADADGPSAQKRDGPLTAPPSWC